MATNAATIPVAFSYIRFSSPEQAKGDSLRRQTETAQAWCDRNGVKLDASTTLHDLGTSAFRGDHRKNPDRNALAAFLKLVEDSSDPHRNKKEPPKVPRGSFLLIESLDRLTREHIQPALLLTLNLLQAGIRIVQLKPVEMVFDDKSDTLPIMMMLMELSRGNSESRIKSERIGAAWVQKRTQARNGKLLTRNLPAWVRIESIDRDSYKLALIPERAAIVRRIFELVVSGLGTMRISQKLTQDGVPPFGQRVLTEMNIAEYEQRRKADGLPPLTKEEHAAHRRPGHWYNGKWVQTGWTRAYISKIVRDRRALGDLPRPRRGQDDDKPIPKYYPAVVDEDTFHAARAIVSKNDKRDPGQRGAKTRIGRHVELWSGLIFDALDGSVCYVQTRTEKRGGARSGTDQLPTRTRSLMSASALEGRGPSRSFPLPTFEKAILSMLNEVDPREVLGQNSPKTEVSDLERHLEWLVQRQTEIASELRHGDIPILATQLRDLKAEEDEVSAKLDDARQQVAKPLIATWNEMVELITVVNDPDDSVRLDARRRLRSAIARIVESIQLLVVPHGKIRLAEVQINFKGGNARRNYFIIHRPALYIIGSGVRAARWWANSVKHPDAVKAGLPFSTEDLRDSTEAEQVRGYLESLPVEMIARLLEQGQVIE